jgi:hypothetical protein
MAWSWFTRTGVVTGGDFNETDGKTCEPYVFEDCKGFPADKQSKMPCQGSTPSCRSTCSEAGYKTAYAADKRKADKSYSLSGEQQMMNDIYAHG